MKRLLLAACVAFAPTLFFVPIIWLATARPAAAAWDENLKLTPPDAAAGDFFGSSISMSGFYGVVGSPYKDETGTDSGKAYLIDLTTGEFFNLFPHNTEAHDWFGYSVGISAYTIIVGSVLDDDDGNQSGSAYLLHISGSQDYKLTASDAAAEDNFGHAVGISGDRAIVGSLYDDDDGDSSGSAYLFDTTTGNELFKLKASDAAAGDLFGASVGISGGRAIVGSANHDHFGANSGAAYLYDVTTGSELFELTASDASGNALFGDAVAIDGNVAIVGAPNSVLSGAAYLYDVTTGAELFKLTPSDGEFQDFFGSSVAISGNRAVVGAWGEDDNGNQSGAAYVFDVTTGQQLQKLTASDASAVAQFGLPVAIEGDLILAGAAAESGAGTHAGAAYAFAHEHEWIGPTSGDWDNAANWSSGDVPDSSTANVRFGDAATGPTTVTVDSDVTVSHITFDNSTHSYHIAPTAGHFVELDFPFVIDIESGTHQLDSISGGFGLRGNGGSEKLILGGESMISGFSVLSATLEFDSDALVGPDGGVFVQGQVVSSGDAYLGKLPGSDWVGLVTGEGVAESSWTVSGDFYVGYEGGCRLILQDGGTLSVGGGTGTMFVAALAGSQGSIKFGDSDFSEGAIDDPGTLLASEITGGLGDARIFFDHSASAFELASVLSGSLKVFQIGSGTTTLTGANTYTGTTTVNWGTMVVNGGHTGGGAYTIGPHGTLRASGTIQAPVTAQGTLAPGNSPGILTIDGDYTQTTTGTLEIEVGGLTAIPPNPLHDKLIVTGTATLGGQLDVPIIDGFVPSLGNEITFLEAGSLIGEFSSITSPNLGSVNPDLAIIVNYDYDLEKAHVQFVEVSNGIQFAGNAASVDWSVGSTWTTSTVPDSTNIIAVQNLISGAQRVDVQSENAIMHELTVASSSDSIGIRVQSDLSLSATVGVTIGEQATVELGTPGTMDQGNLVSSTIVVESGGTLAGNGTVVGNLVVGAAAGPEEATLRPGFSVGHLDVEGNYHQQANGTLAIDIEGDAEGQFDTVDVTGEVQLGGTLQVDASNLTNFTPGEPLPILTAGALSGEFDQIETIGNPSIYMLASYDYTAGVAYTEGYNKGDMNGSGGLIDDLDFDLFVWGLMTAASPTDFVRECEEVSGSGSNSCDNMNLQTGGDFVINGIANDRVDFEDIAAFQAALQGNGMSSAGLMAAFDRYIDQVPEPSAAMLAAVAAMMAGLTCRCRARCTLVTPHFAVDARRP